MKSPSKLKILLLLFLPLIKITAFGQDAYDSTTDDEFNVFLLLFATVVLCGMLGATAVGAFLAALLAFAVFGLIAFGILSTAVAAGIYRKSLMSGFKIFLSLLFGLGCGLCGAGLAIVVHHFFYSTPSAAAAGALGFLGGGAGGVILVSVSIKAVRAVFAKAALRLKA